MRLRPVFILCFLVVALSSCKSHRSIGFNNLRHIEQNTACSVETEEIDKQVIYAAEIPEIRQLNKSATVKNSFVQHINPNRKTVADIATVNEKELSKRTPKWKQKLVYGKVSEGVQDGKKPKPVKPIHIILSSLLFVGLCGLLFLLAWPFSLFIGAVSWYVAGILSLLLAVDYIWIVTSIDSLDLFGIFMLEVVLAGIYLVALGWIAYLATWLVNRFR